VTIYSAGVGKFAANEAGTKASLDCEHLLL